MLTTDFCDRGVFVVDVGFAMEVNSQGRVFQWIVNPYFEDTNNNAGIKKKKVREIKVIYFLTLLGNFHQEFASIYI